MIRRGFQMIAVCIMAVLVLLYVVDHWAFPVVATYWRETAFAVIGVLAAWLFAVTRDLRPVVAIFAAAGFFIIAMMDDPSGASFLATLDGIGARLLEATNGLTQG